MPCLCGVCKCRAYFAQQLPAAKAKPGNPSDGHTLKATQKQAIDLTGSTLERVYVDMDYRGHDYEGSIIVNADKRRCGGAPKSVWR